MKKTWNQILESAQPVVDFLSSDSFFSCPYDGDREKFIVTTSPEEDKKLTIEGVVNFLEETMPYYMDILLNCYANPTLPRYLKTRHKKTK